MLTTLVAVPATATTRSMANPAVAKPSKYGAMVSRIH